MYCLHSSVQILARLEQESIEDFCTQAFLPALATRAEVSRAIELPRRQQLGKLALGQARTEKTLARTQVTPSFRTLIHAANVQIFWEATEDIALKATA